MIQKTGNQHSEILDKIAQVTKKAFLDRKIAGKIENFPGSWDSYDESVPQGYKAAYQSEGEIGVHPLQGIGIFDNLEEAINELETIANEQKTIRKIVVVSVGGGKPMHVVWRKIVRPSAFGHDDYGPGDEKRIFNDLP